MDVAVRARYHAWFRERLAETLVTLEELVSINSFSRNPAGVDENGRRIAALLAELGFTCRREPAGDPAWGQHLLLERRGRGPHAVVLVSHLDTVYSPEEERSRGFRFRRAGERIYGPGVADIKGGTVLIIAVLRALAAIDPEIFESLTWHVLLNAVEEEGCGSFYPLARATVTPGALACLVYEPGNVDDAGGNAVIPVSLITRSRRGSARFVVETSGRQAHAGSHHARGASAVRELARLVERIEALTDPPRGLTFNVGRVEGGVVCNTVPDYAIAQVDMRADTVEAQNCGIAALEALAGRGSVTSREDGFATTVRVTRASHYPVWPDNARGDRLARLVVDAAHDAGIELSAERRGGASDGNFLWDLAPTVCSMGPIGRNIHCSIHEPERGLQQESIEPDSFIDRGLVSVATIRRLVAATDQA